MESIMSCDAIYYSFAVRSVGKSRELKVIGHMALDRYVVKRLFSVLILNPSFSLLVLQLVARKELGRSLGCMKLIFDNLLLEGCSSIAARRQACYLKSNTQLVPKLLFKYRVQSSPSSSVIQWARARSVVSRIRPVLSMIWGCGSVKHR